jgi:uncharacterized membrane protein YbjE (DUF340 family)
MLLILGAVSLGCLVGALHLVPPAALPWVDRLIAAGLAVLLFSMGVSIGANPEVVTTMDVTLPIVTRVTRGEMTAVALLQGTCLTLLVPVLLPLILRW